MDKRIAQEVESRCYLMKIMGCSTWEETLDRLNEHNPLDDRSVAQIAADRRVLMTVMGCSTWEDTLVRLNGPRSSDDRLAPVGGEDGSAVGSGGTASGPGCKAAPAVARKRPAAAAPAVALKRPAAAPPAVALKRPAAVAPAEILSVAEICLLITWWISLSLGDLLSVPI